MNRLKELLNARRQISVLTGAGISTESGIPDFRSPAGLYQTLSSDLFDLSFFDEHPDQFYRAIGPFYETLFQAEPNLGHKALARLQRPGVDVAVATQNIDDLHRRAGSTVLFELHGSMRTLTCRGCGRLYEAKNLLSILAEGAVPRCGCGEVLKPDILFFGEELPSDALLAAQMAFESADLVLVLGTSLQVYPAALLPGFRGRNVPLVIVNQTETPLDDEATLVLHQPLGQTLWEAVS